MPKKKRDPRSKRGKNGTPPKEPKKRGPGRYSGKGTKKGNGGGNSGGAGMERGDGTQRTTTFADEMNRAYRDGKPAERSMMTFSELVAALGGYHWQVDKTGSIVMHGNNGMSGQFDALSWIVHVRKGKNVRGMTSVQQISTETGISSDIVAMLYQATHDPTPTLHRTILLQYANLA